MIEVNTVAELEACLGFSLARYEPERPSGHTAVLVGEVADVLCARVVAADPLAIQDACRLIQVDPRLPFGRLIKSNLARALKKRKDQIPEQGRKIIIKQTATLLSLAYCPRETEDYYQLVRSLGAQAALLVVAGARPTDRKSMALTDRLESMANRKA